MKKELSTFFNARQYMQSEDFEIFYYNDVNLKQVSAHYHPHYEFYFFLEGDLDYEIDGVRYSLQTGDYLLIPPDKKHQPIFKSSHTSYRRFVLWLNKDYYDRLVQVSSDFSYSFDYVNDQHNYRFRTDFITYQELQGNLMDLIEETHGTKAFRELSARLMVSSFLVRINKITYDMIHQVSPSFENVLYLNICDYINNHLNSDLTLDHLATFFYVSKYHISHIFKDNMGISLHQYILKKRLHASKNGILSGISISKVYSFYGFNDYTSFYRAFRKEYGLSPKEFKEQNRLSDTFN